MKCDIIILDWSFSLSENGGLDIKGAKMIDAVFQKVGQAVFDLNSMVLGSISTLELFLE